MSSTLRPLYLAKTLAELNSLASKGMPQDVTKNLQRCQKSLDTLVLKSKTELLEGDQELAYIYAIRAVEIYILAKKSTLSVEDKDYLIKYFSPTMKKLMNDCETLSKDLEKRYSNRSKEIQEKNVTFSQSVKKIEPILSPKEVRTIWVSPDELYRILKKADSLLILDVRDEQDFNDCHIDTAHVINIPENILCPGVTVTRIDQYLSGNSFGLDLWTSRGTFEHIIMVDWNTKSMNENSLDNDSFVGPLHVLYRVIMKWDSQHLVKLSPRFLSGGLQDFLDRYPTCVTSCSYSGPKPKSSVSSSGRKTDIDQLINYPSFEPPLNNIINDDECDSEDDMSDSSDKVPESANQQLTLTESFTESLRIQPTPAATVDRSNKPKITNSSNKPRDVDSRLNTKPPPSRPPKPAHMRVSNEAPASISLNKAIVFNSSPSDTSDSSSKGSITDDNVSEKTSSLSKSTLAVPKLPIPVEQVNPKPIKLPQGWVRVHDQKTNRYYYYNSMTHQGTYIPPEIIVSGEPKARPDDSKMKHLKKVNKVDGKENATLAVPAKPIKRSSSQPAIDRLPLPNINSSPTSTDTSSARAGSLGETKVSVVPERTTKPKTGSQYPNGALTNSSLPTKTLSLYKEAIHRIQELDANHLRSLNPTYGTPGPGLTGLRNLGNTCYMNTVLQALCNTPLLHQYFREGHYLRDLNPDNPLGHKGRMAKEFAVMMQAIWSNCYLELSPRDFKDMVDSSGYIFAGSQQQDSQEFLLFLLDGLHEDLNQVKKRPKVEPLSDEEVSKLTEVQHGELSWERYLMLNKSVIVQSFQGQLKSTLTCCTCAKKSVTFDAFMYLSLPLVNNSECSLMDCLMLFLREERMTGDSQWRCPKCKQNRDALKKIDLWKLPPYLLIHLKRFTSSRQKLNTAVNFPTDDMELSRFVCGPKKPEKYRLYALSNHYGRMEGGHYTAFCRNPVNRSWYVFDDEKVTSTSSRDVQTSAAYILFYDSTKLKR